jgi:chromosomal replication initiation ATPase DnaA
MTPTDLLLATIAAHFRLSVDEMLAPKSRKTPALARHVAAYVLRQPPWSRSWGEIADTLRLDRRAVAYAADRIGGLVDIGEPRVMAALAVVRGDQRISDAAE